MRLAASIPGARWGLIDPRTDERGAFRELWRAGAFDAYSAASAIGGTGRFVQANLSSSAPGVLRGLHYHRRQLDYWIVLRGRVFVALVDIRPAMHGDPAVVQTRELVTDHTVTIPIGVAHGFLALEETELLYLVTNEYDGTDELGFAWDDPAVGVPWPRGVKMILSERDRSNPPLARLLSDLRGSSN